MLQKLPKKIIYNEQIYSTLPQLKFLSIIVLTKINYIRTSITSVCGFVYGKCKY